MMIDLSPDNLNAQMADGYLIRFEHRRNYMNDDIMVHARCYTLKGIQITDRCESTHLDGAITRHPFMKSMEQGLLCLSRKRGDMAAELVAKAPIAGHQSCMVVPTRDIDAMKRDHTNLLAKQEKTEGHSGKWKALAKKLMAERDAFKEEVESHHGY